VEILGLCARREQEGFVVKASDRFGDYGLVGAIFVEACAGTLEVPSFLLSCRALGRRIEYQMLAHLGELARQRGLKYVGLFFRPSERNQPALDFVEGVAGQFRQTASNGYRFMLPADRAIAAREPTRETQPNSSPNPARLLYATPSRVADSETVIRIALELSDVEAINAAIRRKMEKAQEPQKTERYRAPATPTEKALAEIWTQVLRRDGIGTHDNFFEAGGNSLLGTVILSRIRKVFDLELPLRLVLEEPTVTRLGGIIDQELINRSNAADLEADAQELSSLSDDKIRELLARETEAFDVEN
jgi:hypothetical protein